MKNNYQVMLLIGVIGAKKAFTHGEFNNRLNAVDRQRRNNLRYFSIAKNAEEIAVVKKSVEGLDLSYCCTRRKNKSN